MTPTEKQHQNPVCRQERQLKDKTIAPDGTLESSKIFPLLPADLQARIRQMHNEASKVSLAVSEADDLANLRSLLS